MLDKHPAIQLAKRFDPARNDVHPYWTYRRDIGAWVAACEPAALMVSSISKKDPPHPVPTSKKADVETGEDMKGA